MCLHFIGYMHSIECVCLLYDLLRNGIDLAEESRMSVRLCVRGCHFCDCGCEKYLYYLFVYLCVNGRSASLFYCETVFGWIVFILYPYVTFDSTRLNVLDKYLIDFILVCI